MIKQKFVANLAFLIFANALVKPFYIFGIDRTVQVTVGTEVYGLYAVLYNFSILYTILLDIGLTHYNNRTIAQTPEKLPAFLPNFLMIKLFLSFFYLLVVFGFAWFWGYRQLEFSLLLPMVASQIFITFILYCRSNLTALHLFRTDTLLSVLDRILVILFCGVLLWGGVLNGFQIEHFIYAQTAAYALTAAVSLALVWRHVPRFTLAPRSGLKFFLQHHIYPVLKASFPYALLIFLMTIYNRMDSVMLEKLLPDGLEQAGIYAAAFRLLDAINSFGILFASLLLPIFARMLAQHEPVQHLTLLSYQLILTLALTVCITTSIFGTPLLQLLYGTAATVFWVKTFQILIFSFLPIATAYIFSTLLTANANLRQLNLIAVGGVLLNLLLNLLLIPSHKAYGAAFATLITQALVSLTQLLVAVSVFKIQIPKAFLIKTLSFIIFLILSNYLIINTLDNWKLGFAFSFVLAVGGAFATKMIDPQLLQDLLKKEAKT